MRSKYSTAGRPDGSEHVDPGGPARVEQLTGLTISKLSVGPLDNNTYLLRDRASGRQLLIDPGAEADRILELIGPAGLDSVIVTHRHPDHWGALAQVLAATGAAAQAHPADAPEIGTGIDGILDHGSTVALGDSRLDVIHLRGHTPGSVALVYRDPDGPAHIFTGDSLFPGGIGKTWHPADFDSLISDVSERLFDNFADSTRVHPGHGDGTTLGRERPQLADWRERRW